MPTSSSLPAGSAVLASPSSAPALRVGDLLADVRARLDAIVRHSLPLARAEREFLVALWYSDAPCAALLHVDDARAIPCDPAGADRLADALASEDALVREVAALRELETALETYEAGGRLTLALLDGAEEPDDDAGDVQLVPPPGGLTHPATARGREQTRRLAVYLAAIDEDVAGAVADGLTHELASLTAERCAVSDRLRERLAEAAAGRRQTTCRSRSIHTGDSRIAKSA